MKKIFKTLLLLATVTVSTGAIISCGDDDDLAKADALFRPIINADDNIEMGLDQNLSPYMIVTWDNYTDANQYTVRIESADGTDSQSINTSDHTCRFENLQYDKEYFVYISSANTTTGLASKEYSITATTPDYPTNLETPASTDIIDIALRIKWADGVTYDRLVVIKDADDEQVAEVAVTADDNAAHEKIIGGLEPKTTYRIEAWNGTTYLGKKRATTAASEKFDGEGVDLRGMDVDKAWKWVSTDNLDSLVRVYPDKDITIVLEGGTSYRLQTVKLPTTAGTIKFVTGLTLSGNAVWKVSGNFDLANGINLGGIAFEKIEFTDDDTADESKQRAAGNYGGTYLFNQNSDAVIGTISLKNCTVRYKRGVLRIRSTNVVDNVIIDDCIFEYIGGYGITNVDNDGAAIRNIKVTNSTFANCVRLFVNTKSKTSSAQKVDIENCTFVYFAGSSRGLIELQENEIPGGITMKNCIYGSAGEVHSAPQQGIKGWTGKVVPNVVDCFFTSDLVWALKDDGTPNNAFDGTTLATDTKGTFRAPNPGTYTDADGNEKPVLEPGDYTLINAEAIKAKVGDPRWLP